MKPERRWAWPGGSAPAEPGKAAGREWLEAAPRGDGGRAGVSRPLPSVARSVVDGPEIPASVHGQRAAAPHMGRVRGCAFLERSLLERVLEKLRATKLSALKSHRQLDW